MIHEKMLTYFKVWGLFSSGIECLTSKCKVLGLKLSTAREKKKTLIFLDRFLTVKAKK
jgi:hypothetical protein